MRELLIGTTLLFLIGCTSKKDGINPEELPIVEAVYASAVIEPASFYRANASAAGVIDKRFVSEGDTVKEGDVIFQLVDDNSKLSEQSAQLSYSLAQRNLKGDATILTELNNEIQVAKLKLLNDSVNFFRQKELLNKGIGTQLEYDSRLLAYDVSKKQYITLLKRRKRTEDELNINLDQAKNALSSSVVRAGDYALRSRMNGMVYAVFKEQGEYVSMQETVAIIGERNNFIISMSVDEVDIGRLRIGQQVMLRLEAFPDQLFYAQVSKIHPKMDEKSQTFRVEASFNDVNDNFYMGLTGEANIVIAEKTIALTIPREYLIENNQVLTDNGLIRVKAGLSSMSHVEILEGLDKNTKIYKPEE